MPYCVLQDLTKKISEVEIARLSNDIAEDNSIDEINVNEAISDAEELINGYLRNRYALPLQTIPKIISNICSDIAIYNLYLRRYRTKMLESVENHYKNNIKTLEQIQKGFISLGIESSATTETTIKSGFYKTNKTKQDRIFSKEYLNGF